MEAIRHVQTVTNGEIHLQLPQRFWGQEVEIIVLPTQNSLAIRKNLRGCLKSYANPDAMMQEKAAWLRAAEDKYESR